MARLSQRNLNQTSADEEPNSAACLYSIDKEAGRALPPAGPPALAVSMHLVYPPPPVPPRSLTRPLRTICPGGRSHGGKPAAAQRLASMADGRSGGLRAVLTHGPQVSH